MWTVKQMSESLAKYVAKYPEAAKSPLEITLDFAKGPVSKRHAKANITCVGWHGNGVGGEAIGITLHIAKQG